MADFCRKAMEWLQLKLEIVTAETQYAPTSVSKLVGWVERSDTHHFVAVGLSSCKYVGAIDQFMVEGDAMGFARAQPILRALSISRAVPPTIITCGAVWTPMLVRVPFGMCADLARQEFHFMVTERGADTPRSADYATLPVLQGGCLKVTEKSHEADESDNSCYCSLDICMYGAALLRLV